MPPLSSSLFQYHVPFPLPNWSGVASITGRTITRVSGSSFTDGYPGIGIALLFDPSVLDGIVAIPPGLTDGSGWLPDAFHAWYIDSDHLGLSVDATYDLLIPAGTTGIFEVADYIWPAFSSAICYGNGSALQSNPNSTIRGMYPTVVFGGDSFDSGSSSLTTHPEVFIQALSANSGLSDGEYDLSGIDSPTQITVFAYLPAGVYQVRWQSWGTSAPPVGSALVLSCNVVGAVPSGSSVPRRVVWGFGAGLGREIYCGDAWRFFAQVRGNTTINTSVTWSCSGLGSINATTGVYTAPSSGSGLVTVAATCNQDGFTSGSITFELSPQTATTVDINPSTYTPPGGWRLTGDAGVLVSGGLAGGAYLERRLIIPA